MKIIQKFAYNSDCYKEGGKITVKGLMIHSLGCPQPDPNVIAKTWYNSIDVCCQGVLGADGTVIQTLPWNHHGYHCYHGWNGSGNNTHIGVEMCEPSTIRYTGGANFVDNNPAETRKFVLGTYKTAVELFAYLCKMYNLNPLADGVIISHSEGYKRGIASNHGDVEHIWNKFGLTMNQFRKDIKVAMNGAAVSQPDTEHEKEPAKTDSYRVRVSIDDLNIRTGPGTNYSRTGRFTGKGVFTIVETQGNWGRLKSGAGWICLDYAEKL